MPARSDARGEFLATRWTQVSRRALAELCDAYYEPVAAFLRCELRDADTAHDFFANTLGGGAIVHAEQEHFLARHREAARRLERGGGAESFLLNDTIIHK